MKRKNIVVGLNEGKIRSGVGKVVDGIKAKDPVKIIAGAAEITLGILED